MRLINTAEVDYRRERGAYATWGELFLSRAIQFQGLRWWSPVTQFQGLQLSAGPEVVPGWNVALVVSADRHNYELTLRSVDDKQCRFSFFSDDSGLIYEGGAISCSVELVPNGNSHKLLGWRRHSAPATRYSDLTDRSRSGDRNGGGGGPSAMHPESAECDGQRER